MEEQEIQSVDISPEDFTQMLISTAGISPEEVAINMEVTSIEQNAISNLLNTLENNEVDLITSEEIGINDRALVDTENAPIENLNSSITEMEMEEMETFVDNVLANNSNLSTEITPEIKENPLLPENSKTLNIKETTSRFSGAIWAEKIKEINVLLAGCGGIGSWTALLLSRLGIKSLALYDDDVVDFTNISGQLFSVNDVDINKVSAIRQMILKYSSFYDLNIFPNKFTSNSYANKVMICGFDNMEARKTFFKVWYNNLKECAMVPGFNAKEYLLIDGRLAAEELQVFCLRGDDIYSIEKYINEYLFSDEEAEATVCSYKQTSFMSNMIAGIINNLFVNYVTNLCDVPLERDLPFFTSYQADYMIFKTVH